MTDIVERLRAWCTDWNGAQMVDGEPPRDGLHCDELREAAAEIERLRAAYNESVGTAAAYATAAVRAEREACAILADERGAVTVAAAIRARGDSPLSVADKPLTDSDQITD